MLQASGKMRTNHGTLRFYILKQPSVSMESLSQFFLPPQIATALQPVAKKLQTRVTEYSVRSISLIGSDIFTLLVVVSVLYAFDALDGDREEHDLRDLYIPGDTYVDHVVFSNCTD